MTTYGGLHFVVRSLDWKALDGAFRVHIAPDCLVSLGLRTGDVCQISTEHGEAKGYGIAWQATDKMGNAPKFKPAKMTDYMKSVLDIRDGTHVVISKSAKDIVQAAKIVLSDVTPGEYGISGEVEDNRWRIRCSAKLGECEAIAVGATFDVNGKKSSRKRFCVEHIEPAAANLDATDLYNCDDNTQVVISDGKASLRSSVQSYENDFKLITKQIGGLKTQMEELNRLIRAIGQQSTQRSVGFVGRPFKRAVLIHGYEGTGKTMLLERMEECGFRKVLHLQKSTLTAASASKNMTIIQATFDEARANQPSIILMDDLHQLVPSKDDTYAGTISKELGQLQGTQIFVVATCRSLSDVNNALFKPKVFSKFIELPIPDLGARMEILDALLDNTQVNQGSELATRISLRTHGFTGRDLELLLDEVQDIAYRRIENEHQEWVKVQPNDAKEATSYAASLNGADAGQHAEQFGKDIHDEGHIPKLAPSDLETALVKIRPSALREIVFETPKVHWSDIGGSQAMKDRMDEIIAWPLQRPDMMKQLGVIPDKGVLLYGPPGCSKTLTAQAVASTYDLNFIPVKGAELISMYVGESERAIREIFRKARAAAPCIIFFDEIDSIASERDNGGTKGLNVLTTLLNEMDGFEALNGVLVLAATNKPETLDPAIMRPGRFTSHVYVAPPNEHARREIFTISIGKNQCAHGVDLDALVKKTEGHTGAEIVQLCNYAKLETMRRAVNGGDATHTVKDFETALSQTPKLVTSEMLATYEAFDKRHG